MWHLPEQKQKVYVWPTPGLVVPSGPPHPSLVSAPIPMAAKGQVVIWDEFRHRQYLSGELQFHDPRSKEEQAKDKIEDALLRHVHKPKYPPELHKKLHQLADQEDGIAENVKAGKKAWRPPPTPEELEAAKKKAEAEAKKAQPQQGEGPAAPAAPAQPAAPAKKE